MPQQSDGFQDAMPHEANADAHRLGGVADAARGVCARRDPVAGAGHVGSCTAEGEGAA